MDKDWRLFGNDDLMFGKTLQHKTYKDHLNNGITIIVLFAAQNSLQ